MNHSIRKFSLIMSSILFTSLNYTYAADENYIHNLQATIPQTEALNKELNLSKLYGFKTEKKVTLPNKKIKNKLVETYLNIPVWGVSLAATQLENGNLSELSGNYLANIEKDLKSIQATFTPKEVMNKALKIAGLKANETPNNIQIATYIMQTKDQKAHLIYLISFMLENEKPSRPYFIFDAINGELLDQWNGLTTQEARGPGGNEKTGQYYYGRDYGPLIVNDACQMDTPNVATYNLNNRTSGGVLFQFTCPENTYKFTNGAYSPLNDAHYFGNVTFNMYKAWFNTAPLRFKLRLNVHYGNNYENAFWDGQSMTFGDGANYFYPLVSLDVVAHEVSHGFTEQNSNLVYQRQPGGINESFSDIAGEAAEYFSNTNRTPRNDWLVGATIFKRGEALRYFATPRKDGYSIDHAKDYYNGLDVHYSSGVFNKAFYTLATKANWTTEKAFRAFVLANQVYWNSNSDFINAACGVYKAASDLGYTLQDVADAFNVVGVNATCGTNPPPPPPPPPGNCQHAIHTMTFTPDTTQVVSRGESATFAVTIKNNDSGSNCTTAKFTLSALKRDVGINTRLNPKDLTIAAGQTATSNLVIRTNRRAEIKTYTIPVSAKNASLPDDVVTGEAKVQVVE